MNRDPDYISRIKELKKEKGINNNQLAELSGVPVGTLTKILSSVSDSVKLSNICAICKALDSSLDYVVFGIPENTNNYTLAPDEIDMIEDYRRLDDNGAAFVNAAVKMARGFNPSVQTSAGSEEELGALRAKVLSSPHVSRSYDGDAVRRERRRIDLFNLPVSAGTGEYLDSSDVTETISIPVGPLTDKADYAVRISGHSMEPRFRDGDVVLVERTDSVEIGELCIFTLNDCGYFKVYGGDCLISLNPEFGRIMLKEFDSVICCGRVLGKLKKSVARK